MGAPGRARGAEGYERLSEVARPGTHEFELAAGLYTYLRGLGPLSSLPGDITTDNLTVLEEDMVFVMHPNQYLPETGYLMCGEPVRITPDGAESFSPEMATLGTVAGSAPPRRHAFRTPRARTVHERQRELAGVQPSAGS